MQYFKKFYSNKGDEIPVCFNTTSSCPRCHSAIEPVLLWGYVNDIKKGLFSVFLQCNACNNTFISSYEFTGIIEEGYTKYRTSSLTSSEPISITKKSFSDEINKLSPNFVRVYNQAFAAEQN